MKTHKRKNEGHIQDTDRVQSKSQLSIKEGSTEYATKRRSQCHELQA